MRKAKEGLVGTYGVGRVETTTYFPNGEMVCKWCELYLRYERDFRRYSCRLTGEWILEPEYERGQKCPLEIEEEREEREEEVMNG